jgi:hypothetical protein
MGVSYNHGSKEESREESEEDREEGQEVSSFPE